MSQQICPYERTITDEASGQEFLNNEFRLWWEGHASREDEVKRLKKYVELSLQGLRTAQIITGNKTLFAKSIAALEMVEDPVKLHIEGSDAVVEVE